MRSLAALSLVAAVAAQPPAPATWYGIAPDATVGGQINLFSMTPNGIPENGVAVVITQDREYPKVGTLRCSWGSPVCYFATGVGAPYTQDAVLAVNRSSGQTIFRHELPAGIFIDNLVYDWDSENLYSVAFDPQVGARIVSYDGATGAPTVLTDITQDLQGGFVDPADVTICPSTKTLYVGVDSNGQGGTFLDFILAYDLSVNPPKLSLKQNLLFPIPTGLHAICNATNLQALLAAYVQADDIFSETLLLVNVLLQGQEGFPIPIARGDLPTFSQRGAVPLYLNDMVAEFGGNFLTTAYPPFQAGPGPAPQVQGGVAFTWAFTPQPSEGTISPIGYFLAGASGVPGR